MGTATLVYYAQVTVLHAKYKPSFLQSFFFFFLMQRGEKIKEKKKPVFRTNEEIKARAEKGGLSVKLGAAEAACCSAQHWGTWGDRLALGLSTHLCT